MKNAVIPEEDDHKLKLRVQPESKIGRKLKFIIFL